MSNLSGSAKVGLVIGTYVMACIVGDVCLWRPDPLPGRRGLLMLFPTGLSVTFLVRWSLGRRENRQLQEQ